MRFIGSKENLLEFIANVLEEKGIREGVFCDIFAGTTVVSRYFKKKGFKIVANDCLYFSYVLAKAYIENNEFPQFQDLLRKIFPYYLNGSREAIQVIHHFLNNIPPRKAFIYKNYCPEGSSRGEHSRKYFTKENATRIDSIRKIIEDWKNDGLIKDDEYYVLLASLIEAVPFVSNISGTYGAFLKTWDKRAFKKITLEIPEIIPSLISHQVYKEDANALIGKVESDVLYIDPPYNARQYGPNYHILDTIALWDSPILHGKTGLRDCTNVLSKYCQKHTCADIFEDLINKARTKHILLSYNTEGLMSEGVIKSILDKKGGRRGKVQVFERPYKRFKSHSRGENGVVLKEKIYYVETKSKKIISFDDVDKKSKDIFKKYYRHRNERVKGKYHPNNKLNDLSGKEWVYFLNSVEVTNYSTHGAEGYGHNLRKVHPSPKPPQLMERLVRFFTKKNMWVLDPFAGVGGTLLGSSLANRNAVGIDLSKEYHGVYAEVCKQEKLKEQIYLTGDSRSIDALLKNKFGHKIPKFDLILTDPPYGNMMTKKKTGEAAKKKEDTSPTPFTNLKEDIGNLDIESFLVELKHIIENSMQYLIDNKYIVVFCKDFQPTKDDHSMLHSKIVETLSQIYGLKFKGLKIWYDKTLNLYPYGYPYAYVSNQLHQYILIFRKEKI